MMHATPQEIYELRQGSSPLLISMPHVGTRLPDDLMGAFSEVGLQVDDTDWHIAELYDFAADLGASVIRPFHSRYVIDLNRPADGKSLYPGQNTTGLCPLTTFDNLPLYRSGREPDADEIARRLQVYWHPYHAALQAESWLADIRGRIVAEIDARGADVGTIGEYMTGARGGEAAA